MHPYRILNWLLSRKHDSSGSVQKFDARWNKGKIEMDWSFGKSGATGTVVYTFNAQAFSAMKKLKEWPRRPENENPAAESALGQMKFQFSPGEVKLWEQDKGKLVCRHFESEGLEAVRENFADADTSTLNVSHFISSSKKSFEQAYSSLKAHLSHDGVLTIECWFKSAPAPDLRPHPETPWKPGKVEMDWTFCQGGLKGAITYTFDENLLESMNILRGCRSKHWDLKIYRKIKSVRMTVFPGGISVSDCGDHIPKRLENEEKIYWDSDLVSPVALELGHFLQTKTIRNTGRLSSVDAVLNQDGVVSLDCFFGGVTPGKLKKPEPGPLVPEYHTEFSQLSSEERQQLLDSGVKGFHHAKFSTLSTLMFEGPDFQVTCHYLKREGFSAIIASFELEGRLLTASYHSFATGGTCQSEPRRRTRYRLGPGKAVGLREELGAFLLGGSPVLMKKLNDGAWYGSSPKFNEIDEPRANFRSYEWIDFRICPKEFEITFDDCDHTDYNR